MKKSRRRSNRKYPRMSEWRQQVAEQYGTLSRYVVRSATMAARGYAQTERLLLAELVSPRGGRYSVFGLQTARQRKKGEHMNAPVYRLWSAALTGGDLHRGEQLLTAAEAARAVADAPDRHRRHWAQTDSGERLGESEKWNQSLHSAFELGKHFGSDPVDAEFWRMHDAMLPGLSRLRQQQLIFAYYSGATAALLEDPHESRQ